MVCVLSFDDIVVKKISTKHIPESVRTLGIKYMKEVRIEFLCSVPEVFQIIHPIIFLTYTLPFYRFRCRFPVKFYISEGKTIYSSLRVFVGSKSKSNSVNSIWDTQNHSFEIIIRIGKCTREKPIIEDMEKQFLLHQRIANFISKWSSRIYSTTSRRHGRDMSRVYLSEKSRSLRRLQSNIGRLKDTSSS